MAETKAKAQTTAEPKAADSEVVQAARTWTETLREAGKAVADTAIAMQDRNVHFTRLVIDQGLKQIEDQSAALRRLNDTLASQSESRRAAFRDLGREAVQAYISFLATPVRLVRKSVDTARETGEQGASREA